ncbi:enhancer of split M1 protein-like [Scaptodrosophila lebanonensis]|uniref:Enhancer of split M1 protein-like n=1 Tax=Drosophila lebanonensis TaxID=7225 RepID=A0A6J2UCK7_DROLE|nr:enhancer of split M1 protein-like [Scaptodrosophila lebanonensis]
MKFILVLLAAAWAICVADAQKFCSAACPKIFDPVCGHNGRCYKQFSNNCIFDYEQCMLKKNQLPEFNLVITSKCGPEEKPRCSDIAVNNFGPQQ